MTNDVVRYGVVGTGYFGAELARAMRDNDGAKIVAVFDPENGETIADELKCEAVDNLDSLVTRDDIDCVIVATPNYLHKEPVIKAAQNHKNVFCEKPIALNYQDCVDMVNACKEAGVIFMAGHIMNFFNGTGNVGFLTMIAALCIPLLAGGSQWYSTKLITANSPTANQKNGDDPSASMMKSMNVMMPLMSVFFCFTFASGIGIYWVAQSVLTIIQQVFINAHLKNVDIDDMVQKNIEKTNKKRAKKGLPPTKVGNVDEMMKKLQEKEEQEESKRMEKIAKSKAQVEESNRYYNENAKPGSLAAKANMVAKYNAKHEKGGKK